MPLSDGYHDVAPGKVAAIVTHLERSAPAPSGDPLGRDRDGSGGPGGAAPADPVRPAPAGFALARLAAPDPDWYRRLFRRIGEDWLWFSRLKLAPDALAAVIGHADVEIFAATLDGREVGLMELDFRQAGACEIAFFGLVRDGIGKGLGRHMMTAALARAAARGVARVHVHTCTLDHPGALAFYRRAGFVAHRRQVEIADDPRLSGILTMTAAPGVPLISVPPAS